MGLFRRLVIAVEKIASREPLNVGEIAGALDLVLQKLDLTDMERKREGKQEHYNYLKKKQAKKLKLTAAEKDHLKYGDELVEQGKLKAYK